MFSPFSQRLPRYSITSVSNTVDGITTSAEKCATPSASPDRLKAELRTFRPPGASSTLCWSTRKRGRSYNLMFSPFPQRLPRYSITSVSNTVDGITTSAEKCATPSASPDRLKAELRTFRPPGASSTLCWPTRLPQRRADPENPECNPTRKPDGRASAASIAAGADGLILRGKGVRFCGCARNAAQ